MSSIVTYKGHDWSLLEATNKYLLDPPMIDRSVSSSCYPSNASCWVQGGPTRELEGGCNRASYYRMVGEPPTNPMSEYSYYINEHGKFIEQFLIDKWMKMGIWVANNIKFFVPKEGPDAKYGFPLSGEIDCFIKRHPSSRSIKDIWLTEIKTYYKWFKKRELLGTKDDPGKPAYNNLFQIMLYLDFYSAIGIENGKILYTSRDEACQVEFDVRLKKIDNFTYALVNGVPDMSFTLEGVIARFKELWAYYERKELPPRDFKLVYDQKEMEEMWAAGQISKTKYQDFQKGKDVGDWQCLAMDTKVLTQHHSWKSIQDITTEDMVMTRKGWKRVLKAGSTGEKPVVKLKSNIFLPLEVTPDHQLLVGSIPVKRGHVSAGSAPLSKYKFDIVHGMKFKPVQNLDFSEFNYLMMPYDTTITDEGVAYWVGRKGLLDTHLEILAAYASDGSVEGDFQGISIAFGSMEHVQAERLERLFKDLGFSKTKISNVSHGVRLRVWDRELLVALIWSFIKYEGEQHTGSTKCLSPFFMTAPPMVQFRFLEFLHSYDGCKTTMRGKEVWSYSTTSKTLALQLQTLYFRAGHIAGLVENIRDATNYCTGPLPRYMLTFQPQADWHYGFLYEGSVYQQITGVQQLEGVVPVYDLTIEDESEFTTQTGIVHNCSFCNHKDLCWDIKPGMFFI